MRDMQGSAMACSRYGRIVVTDGQRWPKLLVQELLLQLDPLLLLQLDPLLLLLPPQLDPPLDPPPQPDPELQLDPELQEDPDPWPPPPLELPQPPPPPGLAPAHHSTGPSAAPEP